jgi:hypothetical protein
MPSREDQEAHLKAPDIPSMRDETAVVPEDNAPMDSPPASACIGLKASIISGVGATAQK